MDSALWALECGLSSSYKYPENFMDSYFDLFRYDLENIRSFLFLRS